MGHPRRRVLLYKCNHGGICHQFYFSTNLQGVSGETSRSWVPRYFINVEMVDSGLVCHNGYILPCQCSRGG